MSVDRPKSKVIVIDTDKYAGNFEREMCAYITGQYGECEVGSEVAEEEVDNIVNIEWFDGYVSNEADDRGCYRPASIWQNQEGSYNSVAIFVYEFPDKEVLEEVVKRAKGYCADKSLEYLGIRFFEPKFELLEVKLY